MIDTIKTATRAQNDPALDQNRFSQHQQKPPPQNCLDASVAFYDAADQLPLLLAPIPETGTFEYQRHNHMPLLQTKIFWRSRIRSRLQEIRTNRLGRAVFLGFCNNGIKMQSMGHIFMYCKY